VTSARGLGSVAEVAAALARRPAGYLLAGACGVAFAGRRRLGGARAQDVVAVALVAVAQPFVEWVVHRHVLHGPARRLGGRALDAGAPHRGHHETPDDVDGLLLGGTFAVADAGLVAALITTVGVVVAPALGRFPARGVASGTTAGIAALARYEWRHLLFHSGARLRSARLRRLRTHHLAHHHRDETRWLGVTSDLADRLFGTA
jgi:sterol desaturase/sphingolipid hydroxylase (fatty acid hydroxylase superfamily)